MFVPSATARPMRTERLGETGGGFIELLVEIKSSTRFYLGRSHFGRMSKGATVPHGSLKDQTARVTCRLSRQTAGDTNSANLNLSVPLVLRASFPTIMGWSMYKMFARNISSEMIELIRGGQTKEDEAAVISVVETFLRNRPPRPADTFNRLHHGPEEGIAS